MFRRVSQMSDVRYLADTHIVLWALADDERRKWRSNVKSATLIRKMNLSGLRSPTDCVIFIVSYKQEGWPTQSFWQGSVVLNWKQGTS